MNRAHPGGLWLLEGAGRIPKTAPAARACGRGNRLGGNEVQVLIVWNLIQVIAILQQLPTHILVHLLQEEERTINQDAQHAELLPKGRSLSPHPSFLSLLYLAPGQLHILDYRRKHHHFPAVPFQQ